MELPLHLIRRPLMRTRLNDSAKVKLLMDSIAEIGLLEPVSTDADRLLGKCSSDDKWIQGMRTLKPVMWKYKCIKEDDFFFEGHLVHGTCLDRIGRLVNFV